MELTLLIPFLMLAQQAWAIWKEEQKYRIPAIHFAPTVVREPEEVILSRLPIRKG